MGGRRTIFPDAAPVAARKRKATKIVEITGQQIADILENGVFQRLECCAFVEFSGIDVVRSVADAVALRRAASGDFDGHVDKDGDSIYGAQFGSHKGAVLVTTIPAQSRVYPYLEGAGFQKLGTFRGNVSNKVTIWGAQVIQEGVVDGPKESTEQVKITLPA